MSRDKRNGDKLAAVAIASERAAARLLLLVEEIRRELGGAYGWQVKTARMLGIDQPLVSKIVARGRVSVGLSTVESARSRLGLRHEYFYGPETPRSYHDYQGAPDAAPPYAAWHEFLASETGQSASEEEKATLATVRFAAGEPSVVFYLATLLTLRGQVAPEKTRAAVELTERLRAENAEDRRAEDRRAEDRRKSRVKRKGCS